MVNEFRRYQRVAVFVDAQNVFYSVRHVFHNSRMNFKKLIHKAVNGRQLVRAVSYLVETPDADQTSFREMLEREGYELKIKPVKIRSDGSMKADWDMGIAIDAISMADKLDVVVLVSGDGDFVDMVNLLKSRGVVVEVISVKASTSEDLIRAANFYFPIEPADLYPASNPRGVRSPVRRNPNSRPNPNPNPDVVSY